MSLDRRQLIAATGSGLVLTSCRGAIPAPAATCSLDALLDAHAAMLPEREGAGANHYPMAAEALVALGHDDGIPDGWRKGAQLYTGDLGRRARLTDARAARAAFGDYDRFGDLLDFFVAELRRTPWRDALQRWLPQLAPGIAAAAFHGVIRTGHAARALSTEETDARRHELAVGLAYWAARFATLPSTAGPRPPRQRALDALRSVHHPRLHETADVDFFAVLSHMTAAPLAPQINPGACTDPKAALTDLVRAASTMFLEMLVQKRYRIWLLHTVTGPAAVDLLLPHVDDATARLLVEHARLAAVAMFAAYGAPFVPRRSLRASPPAWQELIDRTARSGSVHTIKLMEALRRFDDPSDPLIRTVGVQWLEWV